MEWHRAVVQELAVIDVTIGIRHLALALSFAIDQLALVNVASQNTRDIAQRQEAAAAFDVAVQRRGLMLTKSQIRRQYDRYNASANSDRATQKVLGAILDSIEAPTRPNREQLTATDS